MAVGQGLGLVRVALISQLFCSSQLCTNVVFRYPAELWKNQIARCL